jgi:hypothetical protein
LAAISSCFCVPIAPVVSHSGPVNSKVKPKKLISAEVKRIREWIKAQAQVALNSRKSQIPEFVMIFVCKRLAKDSSIHSFSSYLQRFFGDTDTNRRKLGSLHASIRETLLASNESFQDSRDLTNSDFLQLATYFKLTLTEQEANFMDMFDFLCRAHRTHAPHSFYLRLRSYGHSVWSRQIIVDAFDKVRSTLAQRYLDRKIQATTAYSCIQLFFLTLANYNNDKSLTSFTC